MSFGTAATDIAFYVFSMLGLLSALLVVLGRNPISCAFSLVLTFFCIAATYVLLHAHFIAALQILVYAGAVMVLFVFVIMLLNADLQSLDLAKGKGFQLAAAGLCFLLLVLFSWSVVNGKPALVSGSLTPEKVNSLGGNVQVVSELMFSDYILPFEITSILLLVGIVGSVALAKRRLR